jgi:hypothetical protein
MSGGFGEDAAAISDGAVDDVFAGFKDDDFLAVDEGEHGIGRGFGVFDEIAVDDQRISVEPGEMNHGGRIRRLLCLIGGRRREVNEGAGGEGWTGRAHVRGQRKSGK